MCSHFLVLDKYLDVYKILPDISLNCTGNWTCAVICLFSTAVLGCVDTMYPIFELIVQVIGHVQSFSCFGQVLGCVQIFTRYYTLIVQVFGHVQSKACFG